MGGETSHKYLLPVSNLPFVRGGVIAPKDISGDRRSTFGEAEIAEVRRTDGRVATNENENLNLYLSYFNL